MTDTSHDMSPAFAVDFGQRYAVLNLDWMSILIDIVEDTADGQTFISSCRRWNDAVHAKEPRPLTIFTSLSFSSGAQPELAVREDAPFTKLVRGFDTFERGSAQVQIDARFVVDEKDLLLQKTRWYAGAGNALEQILQAQEIKTVIISGLSLSGVVMSTVYRLFDLDYNIFVIMDNVIELPGNSSSSLSKGMFRDLLLRMNLRGISIAEAMRALGIS